MQGGRSSLRPRTFGRDGSLCSILHEDLTLWRGSAKLLRKQLHVKFSQEILSSENDDPDLLITGK